jgi:hypothetical protein
MTRAVDELEASVRQDWARRRAVPMGTNVSPVCQHQDWRLDRREGTFLCVKLAHQGALIGEERAPELPGAPRAATAVAAGDGPDGGYAARTR